MDQETTTVPRRLRRRSHDRVIGGVCGGIADYLGVDPVLVRLAAVGLTIVGGAGVLAYIIAWLVLPEDDGTAARVPIDDKRGIAAIALVGVLLLVIFDDGWDWHDGPVLPILLLAAGAYLLLRDRDGITASEPSPAPWDPTAATPTVLTDELDATDVQPAPAWTPPPWTPPPSPSSSRPPNQPRPVPPRSILGTLVLGTLLLAGGAVWLLDVADVVEAEPGDLLAGALIVVGLGLVVGAWYGRSRALIAVGVLLILPLSAISMLDMPFTGGFGERSYTPARRDDVPDAYRLIGGDMLIDLTDLPREGTHEIEASVAFGELTVVVPRGVRLQVDADIGGGEITAPSGLTESGLDVAQHYDLPSTRAGAGTVVLDLSVGFGTIVVIHG